MKVLTVFVTNARTLHKISKNREGWRRSCSERDVTLLRKPGSGKELTEKKKHIGGFTRK